MEATNLISRATPNLCVGGNVWRHQELLVRLAKYSSAFVRKQVPLDGRLLVLVDTVLMPAQPAAARLYCAAALVDAEGQPFPLLEAQCTAVQEIEAGEAELSWREELGLVVPRRVLAVAGAALQLSVVDADDGAVRMRARRPLHLLCARSLSALPGEVAKLDDDWLLQAPPDALDQTPLWAAMAAQGQQPRLGRRTKARRPIPTEPV